MKTTYPYLLSLLFVCFSVHAESDSSILGSSPLGEVTELDFATEIADAPQTAIDGLVHQPALQQQVVNQLLLRRLFAAKAEAEGIDQDRLVARRLTLLRERVLAEAFLKKRESDEVKAEAIEGLAQSEYNAHPERFLRDEEVHLRHLLIARNECEEDQGKARAEELLAKINSGEPFESLAEEHSADPGSAKKGGDLGFVPRGKTVKPFEEAAFALREPGDLSDIVETKFGFHIIRLEERRSAGPIPYEEVRERLAEQVGNRLRAAARTRTIEAMLKEADISIDEAALADALERVRESR